MVYHTEVNSRLASGGAQLGWDSAARPHGMSTPAVEARIVNEESKGFARWGQSTGP